MTHQDLIRRAERWLRGTKRCSVVITEMVCFSREIPDAIGWTTSQSILVECKASRADFLKDKKKFFRRDPEYGMGDLRFYMTPPGLITTDELPPKWGLLEARPKQIRVIMWAAHFNRKDAALNERPLLFSALRRLTENEKLSF